MLCFVSLFLKLDSHICPVLPLPGATHECKRQAGKRADQGQGQGRGRKQTSTSERLGQYKKSGIWKYYRKSGFEIESLRGDGHELRVLSKLTRAAAARSKQQPVGCLVCKM